MKRKSPIKKIMCIMGTRPEFIRMAPIIFEIQKRSNLELQFVHTGQHYSFNMDRVFFKGLAIPDPLINFNIGSGTQVEQVSRIIAGTGKIIDRCRPDIVVVWGDTNSSLAGAIGAVKAGIPVAHLESGCRSYDIRMPEETNRVLIDHCASILFPFSSHAKHVLEAERVSGKILQVGSPHLDIFLANSRNFPSTNILKDIVIDSPFILMTCHRAENVDNKKTLSNIIDMMIGVREDIVFPIHPRTMKNLKEFGFLAKIKKSRVKLIDPVGYFEMMDLLLSSKMVITDSGGVQLEAFFAKKPCITIRRSTEWVETVELGANILVDPESPHLIPKVKMVVRNLEKIASRFKTIRNPYGKGHASKEVIDHLVAF